MPRFHFHVYDGVDQIDGVGMELSSWEAARIEAVRMSGAIITHEASWVAEGEDWRMEVTDATGLVLFRLDFVVLTSPATRGAFTHVNKPR